MALAERQIGRYELREQLGRGGTGTVYLAWDTALGRQVALKLLRFPSLFDPDEIDRQRRHFRREARTAGRLSHPNVVTIYDTGQDRETGAFYIAMEYIQGTDLRTLLREQGPLDLPRLANLLARIADALDYLHAEGIIHRDIKPANILIDENGRVKLTDFGVALLNDPETTHELAVLGTPAYIAPEQMQGRVADHRVDVFALGVLVHEALTGEPPFRGGSLAEIVRRVIEEPFDPQSGALGAFPYRVREVVARALEKRPEQRYGSAGELAEALHAAILEHRDELPSDEAMATLELAPARRRRRPWLAVRRWRAGVRRRLTDRYPKLMAHADRISHRVQTRRVVPAAAAAALLLLALYGFAQQRLASEAEAEAEDFVSTPSTSPEYWTLLDEASRRIEGGDPQAAAYFLELAGRLAPERRWEVRRLHDEAAAELATREAAEDERGAETPGASELAARHTRDVLASARELLMLEIPEAEAQAFVAEIEAALARRGAPSRPWSRRDLAAAEPTGGEAEPHEPRLQPATGPTILRLELTSEHPEGILLAYLDDQEVLRRSFSFSRRTGLWGRQPAGGSFVETLEVEPGGRQLRLSLLRPDEAPAVIDLDLELAPGEETVIQVRSDADGEVTVQPAAGPRRPAPPS